MIVSPKRILWPTDLSPLSFKAAEYARGFREIFGADLHVVHVCQPVIDAAVGMAGPYFNTVSLNKEIVDASTADLEKLVKEVFPKEKPHHEILIGHPWVEICAYAGKHDIDMIIVATHGRTGIKHVFMGSVAERIVQHADCPVLVVKSLERDFTLE
jgi:nucleotide-binding universal stress UspA family protein